MKVGVGSKNSKFARSRIQEMLSGSLSVLSFMALLLFVPLRLVRLITLPWWWALVILGVLIVSLTWAGSSANEMRRDAMGE